jgi:hypothetical protein
MILKTPLGYLFEISANTVGAAFQYRPHLFDTFGLYASLDHFIELEREFIEDTLQLDPDFDSICAYSICDDLSGWRCERGVFTEFEKPAGQSISFDLAVWLTDFSI